MTVRSRPFPARITVGLAAAAAALAVAAPSPALPVSAGAARATAAHATVAAQPAQPARAVRATQAGAAAASDPAFAAQPQAQTVPDGGSVTFSADFPGARFHTWYRTDAKGSVPLPNSNSATYTFTANYADNGATYSVKVFDGAFAQHTSDAAALTVTPVAAGVVEPPHDTSVQAYQTARFTVTAGGTGPFTYRWQRQDAAGSAWSDIAGASTAELAFKSRPADDGARYRVVVDNGHGPSVTSAAARLGVVSGGGSPRPVSHASLEWGVNSIYQGGNPANAGCNFFSAGTQREFKDRQGGVRIVHRVADGTAQGISDATKCIPGAGSQLNQRVLFTEGSGTADPVTGEATIRWEGAFTANAYAGMVTWYVKDPTLTVAEDGTGTLTATSGGMGSSRDNPGEQEEVPARRVTVATFDQVRLDTTAGPGGGVRISPRFSGVDYFPLTGGVRSTTSAISGAVKEARPGWGSWPESFVDFQYETGLSSYWHTSGLSDDPDKPPFDLSVGFDSAPDVKDVPVILANPSTTAAAPYVEGRELTVTADVDGDATVRWERSGSAGGPWTAVEGADGETLTIPAVDSSWNNTYVRVVATNGDGRATSTALLLTTAPYTAPTFSVPPRDLAAIQGTRPLVTFRVTGNPAVDPATIVLERSDDQGATWRRWAGAEYAQPIVGGTQQFTLPAVPLNADGASARVVAANAEGARTVSGAFAVRVFRATGKPQLVAVPGTAVDPGSPTRLTVLGAGFDVPDWPSPTLTYSLDVGLFDAETWQPGKRGNRDWVVTSPDTSGGQLYYDSMRASGGAFTASLTVPAGRLTPGRAYGIGAFLRLTDITTWQDTFDDRGLDAWTALSLTTDPPAPDGAQTITATVPERAGEFTWTIDAGDHAVTLTDAV
ncbi:HtaA domain-containing protein, partial [Streptomyces sp. NPDC005722]